MEKEEETIVVDPAVYAIDEGKAIGTSKPSDLSLLADLTRQKDYHYTRFSKMRAVGQAVGRRKLAEIKERVSKALKPLIEKASAGSIDAYEFRRRAVREMKSAWRDTFMAGLRAGGTKGRGDGPGRTLVQLSPGDDAWLKSAMTHEMRYLNGFLDAVLEGEGRMPYDRRLDMYLNTLNSLYDSARVISMPSNVRIYWRGDDDAATCPGCRYLMEHSPYNKHTLPCVPRSGLCGCLSNCRCKLHIVRIDPNEAIYLVEDHLRERDRHIKRLRRLKAGG